MGRCPPTSRRKTREIHRLTDRGIDPSVESMWLRRPPPRPPGRHRLPRASTLLLVAAFLALLVLYFVVQPGH
jgi:hypothetical protein